MSFESPPDTAQYLSFPSRAHSPNPSHHQLSPLLTAFSTPNASSENLLTLHQSFVLDSPRPSFSVDPSSKRSSTESTAVGSLAPTIAEKGHSWENYEDQDFPDKDLPKVARNLRYILLNVYRRLFTICFLVNVGLLIWVAATKRATTPYLGIIVIGNIFASILIRNEHVVNGLFYLFTSVPKW